ATTAHVTTNRRYADVPRRDRRHPRAAVIALRNPFPDTAAQGTSPGRVATGPMSSHAISESTLDGHAVRVLQSPAGLEATFSPGVGMIGCSLRHVGEELLGQRGGLAKYADTGSTMGIPLLHPWANRLDGLEYEVEGVAVRLDPDRSPVRLDPNGLPIHGLATANRHWVVKGAAADGDAAMLSAGLAVAHPPA